MLIYILTVLIYGAVGLHLYACLISTKTIKRTFCLVFLVLAGILHAIVLLPNLWTDYGLNLNVFNSLSLTGLFFLGFFVLFSLYRPILSLGILAVPTAMIGLSAGFFGHGAYKPLTGMSILLEAHIVLSFAAYCLLLMASVQAIILKLQIKELKRQSVHRFWVSKLPSLQSMESLLFDMILLGFVVLSFALTVGFLSTYDIFAQHIAHKTFFSALSWLVFGGLIVGHYRQGWTTKQAANMTIYGFVLLAIGFIGSKTVLELILKR